MARAMARAMAMVMVMEDNDVFLNVNGIVSEDGEKVYVDPAAIEDRVRQAMIQASTPTPEQVRLMEQQAKTEEVRREYPVELGLAEQADQYVTEHVKAILSSGFQPRSVDDITAILRERGVDQQVAALIPEMDGLFEDFVTAFADGNPSWKRSVVKRMAERRKAQSSGTTNKKLSPKSLARKGGSRTPDGATSDRKEFQALEAEFRDNFFNFPAKKYDRLKALGKKLGEDGWA